MEEVLALKMVILSGLSPLPLSEKLEADRGIYTGQDYSLFIRELPLYLFTGYTFDAAIYKANDEAVNFPITVVKNAATGNESLSLFIPDSITESFIVGDHYLLRVNVTNDSTSDYSRLANLCCVCYR